MGSNLIQSKDTLDMISAFNSKAFVTVERPIHMTTKTMAVQKNTPSKY